VHTPSIYITEFAAAVVTVCVYLVGLAATVPWLELLVSLLGAVKMSTLSLMAPALIGTVQRILRS
jgi:hypothetical protein